MVNKFSALLASAAIATGTVATLAAAPAHAIVSNMSTSDAAITNLVSNTSDCERSIKNQDFVGNNNPLTVNEERFFGFNNWAFGGKIGVDAGYTGSGSGNDGSWDISSVVNNTWDNIMLVFKGGNNNLLGYKVSPGATSGTWDTPFIAGVFNLPGNSQSQGVSHISVYYTVGDDRPPLKTVPEPASLIALGLVAGGMVVSRRRRTIPN